MPVWTEEQLRRLFPGEPFNGGGFSVPVSQEDFSIEEQQKITERNAHINLIDYSAWTSRSAEAVIDQEKASNISKLFSQVFSRYHPLPNKFNRVNTTHYYVQPLTESHLMEEDQKKLHPPRFEEVRNEIIRPRNYVEVITQLAIRRDNQMQADVSYNFLKKQYRPLSYFLVPLMKKQIEGDYYTAPTYLQYQFLKEQMYLVELYKNLEELPKGDIPSEPPILQECDQLLLDAYTAPNNQRLNISYALQDCIAKSYCKEAYEKYIAAEGDDKDFAIDALYDCVSSFPEYYHVREIQRKYSN